MSRIGKRPIAIPDGVTVSQETGVVVVRGPKGELRVPLHPQTSVAEEERMLLVRVEHPNVKSERALWGLTARLLENALQGVTKPFEKKLEVHGVGFRVMAKGTNTLELHLGYSHPITVALPPGVTASIEKNEITLMSIDKQLVGETAAIIRSYRKPDAYHGKGVRYVGEQLKLKPGKAVKGAGA